MTNRFVFRKFALLAASGFVCLLAFPHVLRPQESASAPKSASGAPPVSQTAPKPPEEAKEVSENKVNINDRSILTRELLAVTPSVPILVEKAEVPNTSFIREFYRVEWRPQDPFDLYVIRPKGVAKPPVILYLPSFPDDTDAFKDNKWCDFAVRGGYATVGFVGAVSGHRTRYRLMKEWFVSEMPEALNSTTHDVQLILDYLSTRDDLDTNHVAMYGVGSGGSIAILASVVDARIKVLDLVAPWGDWKAWLSESKVVPEQERMEYTKPEFVAKVLPLDPVAWFSKVQAKSLRLEDIRGNKAMPQKSQEKLEAAAPDFALVNQYGNLRSFMTYQVPVTALDWVKSQLSADAKPQAAMDKSARIHIFPPVQPSAPAGIKELANLPAAQAAKAPAAPKAGEKEKENPQ